MKSILFYPAMPTPFPIGGIEERHSATMFLRTLREGAPIRAVLDHDTPRPGPRQGLLLGEKQKCA